MDAQQQELAAFESSIAEAAGAEPTTTDADDAPAVESQPTEASGESVEHEAAEQSAGKESGEGSPDEKEKPKAEDEDPVLLDGLKRSELRRLLGNAADVETLKRQIDKAHGHIGELNRRFQQTQAAAPRAAAAQSCRPICSSLKPTTPKSLSTFVRWASRHSNARKPHRLMCSNPLMWMHSQRRPGLTPWRLRWW